MTPVSALILLLLTAVALLLTSLAVAMALGSRKLANFLGMSLLAVLAVAAIAPLLLIIFDVYTRGVPAIVRLGGWNFFTSTPPTPFDERGGVGPQLLGTLYMTFLGALIGFAVGFPLGVFVGEFRRGALAEIARAGVNILVEFPTITIGLFVYTLSTIFASGYLNKMLEAVPSRSWISQFLGPLSPFNAYAGAIALAVVMVPYVALFTASAYASIEQHIREAAYAFSGREYKAVFVVMRKAVSRAVLAAALLGTAKISGETAPLLFTAFGNQYYAPFTQPTGAIPLWIWYAAQTPYDVLVASAYGAAAVLLTIVLILFITARVRA